MSDRAKASIIVTLAFGGAIQDEATALKAVKEAMGTTRFKVYPNGLLKDEAGKRFLVQIRPLKANESPDGTKTKASQVAKLLGNATATSDEGTTFLKFLQGSPQGAPLTIKQLTDLRNKALGAEVVPIAAVPAPAPVVALTQRVAVPAKTIAS